MLELNYPFEIQKGECFFKTNCKSRNQISKRLKIIPRIYWKVDELLNKYQVFSTKGFIVNEFEDPLKLL
jgi:hypothetical protein